MILSKNFFPKHQNKLKLVLKLLNSRTWITLKSSVVIFQALKPLQPQWPQWPQQPQWPQRPRKPHMIKKFTDPDGLIISSTQLTNTYQSLFVEWIIKNLNFHWYMAPFRSEAVEASLCYFFENSNFQASWIYRYL